MSEQREFFDLPEGERQKEKGIAHATTNKSELLRHAQAVAEQIAASRASRKVSIDCVMRQLIEEGFTPADLGKAAGSVFRNNLIWEFTGEYIKTKRITSHARPVGVWKLRA